MTKEKKNRFNAETLKTVLEKEIDARSAKYWSDQVLATHRKGKILNITHYINAQEIEDSLERIISQLGGDALEQGKVLVSVTDKNGCFVTSDSDSDKIIVSVAYGHEFIIKNKEYPPNENSAATVESPPVFEQTGEKIPVSDATQTGAIPKPTFRSDDKPATTVGLSKNHIKAKRIRLAKELKRKLDELWINRKGLGVDFNNPGSLKIELMEDSPRINKILQEIGEEKIDIRIDQELGLIEVYFGGKIYLKWQLPGDKA